MVRYALPKSTGMRRTESELRNTNQATARIMKKEAQFVVCIRNKEYPASLELRKLYQVLPDSAASRHGQLRIIDESGEDYLYPKRYFMPVHLPDSVGKAVLKAAQLTSGRT